MRSLRICLLLMGVERDFLKQLHGDVKQGIRMNYYPTCARPDLVLGVSPHSDASSISLLVQDDEISALQINHENVWVPVNPIPNAIVVNIGDAMEVHICMLPVQSSLSYFHEVGSC